MDVLIVGASARAASFSADRAGLRPIGIDLFADRDLAQLAPVRQVAFSDYPAGLARAANELAPACWLYTGALENHPDLVDRISARHVLLGNSGSILRVVRDPIALARVLVSAGLNAPEVRLDPSGLPVDGSWLVKPKASGGGRGIRPWLGGTDRLDRRFYYQRRVAGLSLSAQFVARATGISCLGIGRQFVGRSGNPFAYRGSLAPWPVWDEIYDQVERIGRAIVGSFGLLGLFGVDLILAGDQVWLIEVNPRYTASVEAHEWATGQSFLADHLEAFGLPRPVSRTGLVAEGCVAKVILFATHSFVWSADLELSHQQNRMPTIADVPVSGTAFDRGDPVMTLLTSGANPAECRVRLASLARLWRRRLAALST